MGLYNDGKTVAYEGYTGDIGWQTIASISLRDLLDKSWEIDIEREHNY